MDLVNREWRVTARGVDVPPEVVRCVEDLSRTILWPHRAPFKVHPLVCLAMLMYWPIVSLLMGMLTEAQERTFRALLADPQQPAGPDHQQPPDPSGQQANSAGEV